MNIPQNDYNLDAEVEKAVNTVLNAMNDYYWREHGRTGVLHLNHGIYHLRDDELGVSRTVADRVASLFRSKGYYPHFECAFDGTPHTLWICKKPW